MTDQIIYPVIGVVSYDLWDIDDTPLACAGDTVTVHADYGAYYSVEMSGRFFLLDKNQVTLKTN